MPLKRRYAIGIGCLVLAILAGGCVVGLHRLGGPFYYSAEDVHGTVIDEETGQPIEGALVVAVWSLETIARRPAGFLHAQETLTDRQGRYSIRGFSRKRRPFLSWFREQDPRIMVFKYGYNSAGVWNDPAPQPSGWAERTSYWNGKAIALEKHAADRYRYAARDFSSELNARNLNRNELPLAYKVLDETPSEPPAGVPWPTMTREESDCRLRALDSEPANDCPDYQGRRRFPSRSSRPRSAP